MSAQIVTPFGLPGRFYRGNLHTHTTMSDGRLTPAELVNAYKEKGYDFLVASDHFWERFDYPMTDTTSLRSPDFTTLIGAELHAPSTSSWEVWHILGVGLPLDFAPPAPGETGPELARRAAAAGAFIGIAHPTWYALTTADANSIDVAHAVEVYNHNCEVAFARGDGWALEYQLLAEGRRLSAYATDDAHFKLDDAFGGWVQVKSESLTPEALLAALKAGYYYSSQGPVLEDVQLTPDKIVVKCSPAASIVIAWQAKYGVRSVVPNQTEASFDWQGLGDADFIVVTVTDDRGRKAWTNPIWLKDAR